MHLVDRRSDLEAPAEAPLGTARCSAVVTITSPNLYLSLNPTLINFNGFRVQKVVTYPLGRTRDPAMSLFEAEHTPQIDPKDALITVHQFLKIASNGLKKGNSENHGTTS